MRRVSLHWIHNLKTIARRSSHSLGAGLFYLMPTLYDYQQKAYIETAKAVVEHQKIIFQLNTGGGKTAIASTITNSFIKKNNKRVLILVHRQELLRQMRKTLYDWYGIISFPITQETKKIQDSTVFVGMVETVYRRITKNPNYLPEIGLTFIDESHIGNFFKMIPLLHSYVIGLTATPLSAKKTDPLKNYFNQIVTGPQVSELIEKGALVQNITYRPKFAVDPTKFHIKHGEYDEREMATEFSKSKHVQNAVEQFKKYGKGKAIFFNCNIKHSLLVCDALCEAGFNARHIDAESKDREEALEWLRSTDNSIICNVGILTAGFDEPSIETIVMNRSTLSLPLWIQCTGRGSRPYPNKNNFIIIDLGANVIAHGDWCDYHNWENMFHNPPKKSDKLGVAPVKDCPKCEAIISAQTMICKHCGYEFPVKEEKYDTAPIELIVHVRPVQQLIEQGEGKKDYYSFFMIGNSIVTQTKYKTKTMSDSIAASLLTQYHEKAREWCELKNKKFNYFHSNLAKEHLYKELKKLYPQWQM